MPVSVFSLQFPVAAFGRESAPPEELETGNWELETDNCHNGAVNLDRSTALLVVDVQTDFCPGGALAVREGDRVVPVVNVLAAAVARAGGPVFASRDWHPGASRHFAAQGGPWPRHCVQETAGARFHPALRLPAGTTIVTKGDSLNDDGYDAFEGRTSDGRGLADALRQAGVRRVLVVGLATDYCVRASALGALAAGFETVVVEDAVRPVDVTPGDGQRALAEMRAAGVLLTPSSAFAAAPA